MIQVLQGRFCESKLGSGKWSGRLGWLARTSNVESLEAPHEQQVL